MNKSYGKIVKLLVIGAAGGYLVSRITPTAYTRAGQVAVITGSSRGLGLALAKRFGKAGLKLVLVARDAAELEEALNELSAGGFVHERDSVLLHSCDLQDPTNAQGVVDATLRRFGRLDILINNAGIIVVGPVENQSIEAYRQAMAVNFFAALYCIYAALPHFLRQRSGAIVNISSIGGKFAVPHLLPYVAAKFALTGLSEGLQAELRAKGVRVTTVCPGLMRTGGETHAEFHGQIEKEKTWFQLAARTPLVAARVDVAADKIFRAVDEGRTEITITPQAWLAARFSGLAPETTQRICAEINAHFLPEAAI